MNNAKILSAVSAFIVLDNAGSVDWEGTLGSIQAQMEMELVENRESDLKIEAALHSIYDSMDPGIGLPTPVVVQAVSASLAGGNLQGQILFAAKVEDFLGRTNRFVSKRGRSGGLFRIG
jgi:hypothetical protein